MSSASSDKIPSLFCSIITEAAWKHTLAICFLNILLAKPEQKTEPPQGQRIQKFIKQTFEEKISRKKKDIKKLRTTLHTLAKPR